MTRDPRQGSPAANSTPTDPIDRLSPPRCPSGRAAMRQEWRHLLFVHWVVPVDVLRPLVPAELEIDTFAGRAYVGLVPFTMRGVRPAWAPPVPGLSSSHEVNVRTYVHRDGRDPGVWFFSLDAANPVAVWLARTFWHLPYHRARIRLSVTQPPIQDRGPLVEYTSERLRPGPTPATCGIRYEVRGEPGTARPGTLEHFLAERYILYARRSGRLYLGRVHHAPYPLQSVAVHHLAEDLIAAAGITRPDEPPLAHYAEGVRVRVFPLGRVGEPRP